LHQVNTAVNEMDKVTQQNAAMAEQATAAGRSLAQESEQLDGLVDRFKVANVTEIEPARRARAQAQAKAQAARPELRAPAGLNGSAI
jgi:methyl-accepting chemotaxis protein